MKKANKIAVFGPFWLGAIVSGACGGGGTVPQPQNRAPNRAILIAPAQGLINQPLPFNCSASDSDQHPISYEFDWDNDGTPDEESGKIASGMVVVIHHAFAQAGIYPIRCRAKDALGLAGAWSEASTVTISAPNLPPQMAVLNGPANVATSEAATYQCVATDPEGQPVTYEFDWNGDGIADVQAGPADSGLPTSVDHVFNEARTLSVFCRAVDSNGSAGAWSLPVVVTVYIPNQPPSEAVINGISHAVAGQTLVFTCQANDPENGTLTYEFDFDGDGATDWASPGPVASGSPGVASKVYATDGNYSVACRASDGTQTGAWSRPIFVSISAVFQQTITPSGGSFFAFAGNLGITFPAGSVAQPITITVSGEAPSPTDPELAGGTYYEFGPDDLLFGQPVRLVIRYDPSALPPDMPEDSLKLYRFKSGVWSEVPGSGVDIHTKVIQGSISGFSGYGGKGVRNFRLRVQTSGSGTATSSPPGINCPEDCEEKYRSGTLVTLTATPASGWQFNGWSGDPDCSDGQVSMNADKACTANLSQAPPPPFTLTVTLNGQGTVTSDPAGISCPSDCSEPYNQNTLVTLTATPASGWQFNGWSGDPDCSDGQVSMNADKACTANLSQAPPPPFTLTVTLNGQGTVTSDPAGISCPSDCSEPYNQNTLVTLTATHASGWQFNGWSGDPDCSDGQVSMNADKACTANFSQAPPSQYTLTEISSPDGIVKSYPDGIYCPPDCSETYPAGTIVKLAVWPFGGAYEAGTYFTQWTGDPDCADGVVTMNGDRTCGTMFASKPPLKQIVTVMMNGSGTVTSSPSGINCLNDCTELMNFGTVVTLTAIPEPGWQFDGWTGDSYCTSGSGTITTAYDRTCVANFSPATPAEPRIEFLAPPALSRNGRLRIFGSHFGTTPGTVKIGGVTAPLTRWTNNLIVAYVTEQMPLGDNPVQVFASGKASNIKMLHVTSPPPPDGKVKWRLEVDAQYIQHRPAVGPDGTVYVHDARGFLYAVTPGGALKWVFSTPGAHGPPSVGTDGTIYAGAGTKIFAINPDGTLKWQFTDPNTGQGITAGPTVGPDGNIYAVTEKPGLGVFALSPVGTLLWNDTNGGVGFSDVAQLGEEIVFGPAQQQLYFAFDQYGLGQFDSLFGYRMNGNQQFRVETGSLSNNLPSVQGQPAVGPNGNIWISAGLRLKMYHPSGTLQWTFFDAGTSNLKHVDVGPDNVAYVVQNLSYLYAVNPNGTEKWKYTDPGILEDPIVAPNNSLVLVGGRITYGQPGFIAAVSPSGTLAWKFTLSAEHGFLVIPSSRARFSPDSSVAYIGTSRATQSTHNDFSYLYAVQTSP